MGNFLKPGGTGMMAMGNCNGRILEKGSDPWQMGRWSYSLIGRTKEATTLLTITAYCPGERSSTLGVTTIWAQQTAVLFKAGRSETPREAFSQTWRNG